MSKNKGKPQKKHIHYGKGTPAAKAITAAPTKPEEKPSMAAPVNFEKQVTLIFNATDTLFFRESRPMEAMGEAQSVFPPPVRTLAGALRTLIGEHFEVKWHEFNQKKGEHPLAAYIGHGESLGNLCFQGAWLAYNGERLYPAPLHLMKKEEQLFHLELAKKTTWCDLGRYVRLPKLPEPQSPEPKDDPKGGKPLENTWLTREGLEAVLNDGTPTKEQTKTAKELFEQESRIGIARDNATRSVQKGLLYQTQHIRPKAELSIELDVSGLPNNMPSNAIVRLGGEGRTASLSIKQADNTFPQVDINSKKIALYLLTPLYASPCLGLKRQQCTEQKTTLWKGKLKGIDLTLHGAITGKVQRVGGWDMAADKPRPVKSLVPAGSVFFCSVDNGDIQSAIKALHNKHIGEFTEYGDGHIAVGVWNDNETQG